MFMNEDFQRYQAYYHNGQSRTSFVRKVFLLIKHAGLFAVVNHRFGCWILQNFNTSEKRYIRYFFNLFYYAGKKLSIIWGKIDILLNCASITWGGPPEEMSLEKFQEVVATDASGLFICCQEAGKRMLKAGSGSIISIVSIGGISSIGRGHAAYGIGMGAVAQMMFSNDIAQWLSPKPFN